MEAIKISVCIPTMDRWEFLMDSLPVYISCPLVDEIVISDENGHDVDLIQKNLPLDKFHLSVNDSVLGSLFNKIKAASLASGNLVCLLDSDNYAGRDYFETLRVFIERTGGLGHRVIYHPCCAAPSFDFTPFIGRPITEDNLADFFPTRENVILNVGNFAAHKDLLNLDFSKELDAGECFGMCSIFINYLALTQKGAQLVVVPNMVYSHTTNPKGYLTETRKESHLFLEKLRTRICGAKCQ